MKRAFFTWCLIVISVSAVSPQSPLFSPPVNYPTGNIANGVISADFDNDGDYDIGVVTRTGALIYQNNGNGVFANPTYNMVGVEPSGIFAGDFDADGDSDMAVTNSISNNISVYSNIGHCVFLDSTNYAVQEFPQAGCAADLNGDNFNDLAILNLISTTISVFFNNGDGTFQPAISSPISGAPTSILACDFDSDGDSDLAIAQGEGILILTNDGSGVFQDSGVTPAANWGHYVCAAFLNADNIYDLVSVNNDYAGSISVLYGNGDATFQAAENYYVGGGCAAACVGDLNNDSLNDIAVVNYFSNNISVLLNSASDTFIQIENFMAGTLPVSITCQDFDQDGDIDLVVANSTGCNLSILFNNTIRADIGPSAQTRPEKFELLRNYPNPFNAQTVIEYSLPEESNVTLTIYDILGKSVTQLREGPKPAGLHRQVWDATRQSSGIYFYSIRAGAFGETRQMILLK